MLGASLGLTAILGIITILSFVKLARVSGIAASSEGQGGSDQIVDIYSVALTGAMSTVGIALVSCLIGTIYERDSRHIVADRWRRVGTSAAGASLLLVIVASLVHLGSAHGAASGAELGFVDFLSEHPAFPLIGGLAFVALWWAGQTSR